MPGHYRTYDHARPDFFTDPDAPSILFCSAEPRGLCGDPRIFDDLKKVPQVFRNPGGSPAQQNEKCIRCREPLRGDFFTAS